MRRFPGAGNLGLLRRSLHQMRQVGRVSGCLKRSSVLMNVGGRAVGRRIPGGIRRTFFTRTGQPHDNEGKAVLFFIIGANVVVFLAWQSPPMTGMMMDHFALSWPNVQRGRLHTLVTAMFSHATVMHLAFNMLTLYFFAEPAILLLGPLNFLNLYIAAGVLSNIGALAYNKIVPRLNIPASRRVDPNGAMIGASGAVNAAVAFTIAANPRSVIYLYMVIPVPAMLFGVLFIGKDLYGAFQGGDNIGALTWRLRLCFRHQQTPSINV